MSDPVQTTPDCLRKLVRWAHSHGTICSLIPSLQQLTCASHGNVLPPGPGGSSVPVARWGCAAGHSYRWPLSDHGNGCRGSANTSQGPERLVGGRRSNKVTARSSCDLCYNEAASEGEEFSSWPFDNDGCDSSATDEGGDYEPRPSRKRGGTPGRAVTRKKVKQEVTSPEDHDAAVNTASTGPAETDAGYVSQACHAPNTNSQITHTLLPKKALARGPQPLHGQDLSWERLEDPEMELLAGSSYMTESTGTAAGEQNELENLHGLLRAERSRNQQMTAIISSLKQDKEMLQKELAKKADVICDFLQDKLRPGVDSPTIFDSCEEMELHPLDHYRTPKSKWSRDGENPRVRMKNVGGVIARYMAALEEFRCSVSMKVAFDRVGVDRNTISRTASIAELSMAAPEVFHALAPWDEKGETLAHYAHRCRQAMDDNTKAKIKAMKGKGELLPIVSNRPH